MEEDLQYINQLGRLIGQTSSDLSAIALVDQDNRIRWKYMLGNINDRYRHMVTKPGIGITGLVLRFGRTVIVDQMRVVKDYNRSQFPIMLSEQLHSVVAVPLRNEHRIFGVLLVGDRQERLYSADEICHVEHAANEIIATMPCLCLPNTK